MSEFRSGPLTIKAIRMVAQAIRDFYGISNDKPFPIAHFIEDMPRMFAKTGFEFRVLTDSDPRLDDKHPANTDVANHIMYMKQTTYDNMCDGHGFERFTGSHEVGHYILSCVYGVPLYRTLSDDEEVPSYMDPEWQADTFAAELLMPYDECLYLSVEEIERRYRVSKKAAQTRFNKINGISKIIL